MTLEPLLAAPWHVQLHALAALAAALLGAAQFALPKGTLPHRLMGSVWLVLMAGVAVTSAFIWRPTEPDDPWWARFSWIHAFTVLTAFGIVSGLILLSSRGEAMRSHWKPFAGIYVGGLLIAGAFAFFPGRIMHDVLFGG